MKKPTSMLHVRIDDQLKSDAAEALAGVGLSVSDAVRILLTRVVAENGMPAGLTSDPQVHDAWFREKVQEALDNRGPGRPHDEVMRDARARITRKSTA